MKLLLNPKTFILIGFLLSAPAFLHAETTNGPIIRSAPSISIASDQVLGGDFYAAGESIIISGLAEQDVYVIGGTVTSNAPIKQDLVIVGGAVQVHGEVTDDVRIIGGEVVIAGKVGGDVLAVGGTVHILSTAEIGGDVVFYGGTVRIEGPVQGSIYGAADDLRVDSTVTGGVSVKIGTSLTLGGAAHVQGSITYRSAQDLVRAQDARVDGDVTKTALMAPPKVSALQASVLGMLILVFGSLTLYFLSRPYLESLVHATSLNYARFGLIGLGVLFALPFVAVLLASSVVGLLVGAILILVYFLGLLLALAVMPVLVGSLIWYLFTKKVSVQIGTIGIGILGIEVIQLLPFLVPHIGFFLFGLIFLVAFGGLVTQGFLSLRRG